MTKKILLIAFILMASCHISNAQKKGPLYKASDSIKVEKYLKEALHLPQSANKVLFFARKFIGLPYVAHTLEVDDTERLTINMDEVDCTTYIDLVCALTLTAQQKKTSFKDFCYYLQHQRYPNGKITDYTSRNHYYTSWILNCEKQGFTHEITEKDCKKGKSPFTQKQKLNCCYMSKHPDAYKALKAHPEFIKGIKTTENELNRMTVSYIPNENLGGSKKDLSCIKDGDILALVTSIEGLDVSHLGIAVWQGGKLHLLNASGLYKKVLIDKDTLMKYNIARKTNIGVRVIRVLDHNN